MMDLVRATYGRDCNLREVGVTGNDAVTRTSRISGAIRLPSVSPVSTIAFYRTNSHIAKKSTIGTMSRTL